jgi:hypothetical protein
MHSRIRRVDAPIDTRIHTGKDSRQAKVYTKSVFTERVVKEFPNIPPHVIYATMSFVIEWKSDLLDYVTDYKESVGNSSLEMFVERWGGRDKSLSKAWRRVAADLFDQQGYIHCWWWPDGKLKEGMLGQNKFFVRYASKETFANSLQNSATQLPTPLTLTTCKNGSLFNFLISYQGGKTGVWRLSGHKRSFDNIPELLNHFVSHWESEGLSVLPEISSVSKARISGQPEIHTFTSCSVDEKSHFNSRVAMNYTEYYNFVKAKQRELAGHQKIKSKGGMAIRRLTIKKDEHNNFMMSFGVAKEQKALNTDSMSRYTPHSCYDADQSPYAVDFEPYPAEDDIEDLAVFGCERVDNLQQFLEATGNLSELQTDIDTISELKRVQDEAVAKKKLESKDSVTYNKTSVLLPGVGMTINQAGIVGTQGRAGLGENYKFRSSSSSSFAWLDCHPHQIVNQIESWGYCSLCIREQAWWSCTVSTCTPRVYFCDKCVDKKKTQHQPGLIKDKAGYIHRNAVLGQSMLPEEILDTKAALGKGNTGTIQKVIWTKGLKFVALKTTSLEDEGRRRQLYGELFAYVSHQNKAAHLVSFESAFLKDGSISLAIEYMNRGSLQEAVELNGPLSERLLGHFAFQILQGLASLHDKSQLHRDFKPGNLLLNRKGDIKISDFGYLHHLPQPDSMCDEECGTTMYLSPERIHGEPYSYAADIWGFGLCLVFCALGRAAHGLSSNPIELANLYHRSNQRPIAFDDSRFSPEFREFVALCLEPDPLLRGTVKQLQNHPFLTQGVHPPTSKDLRLLAAEPLFAMCASDQRDLLVALDMLIRRNYLTSVRGVE